MTRFAVDGFHDGTFRVRITLDSRETLAKGTTAAAALRDAADHVEQIEYEESDSQETRTDGDVVELSGLPAVIGDILEDAGPGGVNRQVLIERVAELSGATLDDVEEVLGGEIRRGAAIVADGKIRRVPNRRLAGRSGRQ